MKNVLITNLYFAKYTGSELHALEIAKQFEKRGYDVTIAVFQKAYPLLNEKGRYRIINCLVEKLDVERFDVIFVQHYPVFDYLCSQYNLSYKKLIVSKLSVISEYEYLPVCTSDADLILCVSDECANKVYDQIGTDIRVRVFKNSVGEEYFERFSLKNDNAYIKDIAVISNHIPEELLELGSVTNDEYHIDYIGAEYSPRLVNVELLKEYDLVITIGRTVQQCFAVGIPVYVYDYFGGPGYITDDNFKVAEENNFSGRGFKKKSLSELKSEIESNYRNNLQNLKKLHDISKMKYSYDINFEQIYNELRIEKNTDWKVADYYDDVSKLRINTYSKRIPMFAFPKDFVSQLFIDYGEGFKEEHSIKWNSSENYIIEREFVFHRKIKQFRLDPCDVPSNFCIYQICINGEESYKDVHSVCLNDDPSFLIQLTEKEKECNLVRLKIRYKFVEVSAAEIIQLMETELNKEKKQNDEMKQLLEMDRKNKKISVKKILHKFTARKFE